MKDTQQAWGLRVAQERTHDPHNITSAEIELPFSSQRGNEICANVSCCTSPCHHYLNAKDKNHLILWTDASFYPESGRCAAAYGLEIPGGIKISAFRVRGTAARGELLAIFAALKAFQSTHLDRNFTIFSDCQSAIKRIEKLISFASRNIAITASSPPSFFPPSSFPLSPLSLSPFSSFESRILPTLRVILRSGRSISLHWVKGHSGILQNEMIDQAAKKEAQNRNRESLFEEIPEMIGELTLRDKIVENRDEICYEEWRADLDKVVMKAAKSWMAKRVMAGVEQWRGLKPSWEVSDRPKDCPYCRDKHSLTFDYFVRKCPSCATYRSTVQSIWEGIHWNDELLEGRVTKKQMIELGERLGKGAREEIVREGRDRMRKWERALRELRRNL